MDVVVLIGNRFVGEVYSQYPSVAIKLLGCLTI